MAEDSNTTKGSSGSSSGGPDAASLAALRAAELALAELSGAAPTSPAAATPAPGPAPTSASTPAPAAAAGAEQFDFASMAAGMQQAAASAPKPAPPNSSPFTLPAFQTGGTAAAPRAIDLLADVNLNVKIELGRTRMLVEDVLRLSEGAVVELDKLAGDPVDVYVNDRHVARGEVLVLNDNFCVRINEIVTSAQEATSPKAAV